MVLRSLGSFHFFHSCSAAQETVCHALPQGRNGTSLAAPDFQKERFVRDVPENGNMFSEVLRLPRNPELVTQTDPQVQVPKMQTFSGIEPFDLKT